MKKNDLTPKDTIAYLDKYIVGQKEAKRAVAIAMRNRWRRQQIQEETMREEISPKNIIMIGPTGVGKTEIARRLSKMANAPFVKVEATKFTEVGYVGKDVESMIRELVDIAIKMVREEEETNLREKAEVLAEDALLDILLPPKPIKPKIKKDTQESDLDNFVINLGASAAEHDDAAQSQEESNGHEVDSEKENISDKSREKLRQLFREGKLEKRTVELELNPGSKPGSNMPMIEVVSTGGSIDDIGKNIREMFSGIMPRGQKKKKLPVPEAFNLLVEEEIDKLIDPDEMIKLAIDKVEQSGIIFIDEIDKISSKEKSSGSGPEVSREGVQRDILPIVEGSRVSTKYGYVNTDHILFIAAGAFHVSKPSDLIPELQGRFPIRVELDSLVEEDFYRILTEPKSSLVKQYLALMETEKVELDFKDDGLKEMARYATLLNDQMENIGARRLHTIMEKVLDDISFSASERSGETLVIDKKYVQSSLDDVVKDQDLSRYIL